jgi:hypothetical protein
VIRRDGKRGFAGCGRRVRFGALAPRRLRHEPRNAVEDDAQDARVGTGCRQVQADLGFHLDHARGDLDEAQSQRVELGDCEARAFRHRGAQAPHEPVGVDILIQIAKRHPEKMPAIAAAVRGRSRNHIARTLAEIYPARPDLARAAEIAPGWLVGLNVPIEKR